MQTARTEQGGNIGSHAHLASRTAALRHESETAHYSPCGGCNAFLKKPVPAIAPQCVTDTDGNINLVTRENYEYLRDSYFRYAYLLNIVPRHDPGRSYGEGIANLYDEMRRLVDNVDVNIEAADGKLQFALWNPNEWGEHTLYWFPVEFIERLRPRFRRLVITFLHELMKHQRFSPITEWDEMEWIYEWLGQNIGEMPDECARREMQDMMASYKVGKIHRRLQRVERRRYYKNLPRAFKKHVPADAVEQSLLKLMTEGLQFIGKDKPSVMDFAYDPHFEESPDFYPIRLDQQINLVYTIDDMFIEEMIAYLNDTIQESYEIVPTTVLYLTPETECLFTPNDYSTRFFFWADRFITFIREIS